MQEVRQFSEEFIDSAYCSSDNVFVEVDPKELSSIKGYYKVILNEGKIWLSLAYYLCEVLHMPIYSIYNEKDYYKIVLSCRELHIENMTDIIEFFPEYGLVRIAVEKGNLTLILQKHQ